MELKNEDGLTEKEFLAQYRPGNYERPSVTVDMLIFAVDPEAEDEDPELLLIRRRNHPCIGQWAMPGGNPYGFKTEQFLSKASEIFKEKIKIWLVE